MAETVEELYFQLGLDATNLNNGFIEAQKTVNQNIRKLNREEALIKLRADVEIKGLGENIKLTDALKIRQRELADQLEIQRNRVQLTSAAYEQMRQRHGENAEVSKDLAIQLEQERLVMLNLEQQTRALAETQKVAIGVQWELLGLIEPAMKGIKGLATAGYTLGSISTIHTQIGAAIAMGLAAIAIGTKQASDELESNNMAQLLESDFQRAQVNITNSLGAINERTIQTTERINQAWQNSARQISDSNEAYIQDFLRLEYILFSETSSFGDELQKVVMQMSYMQTSIGKTATLGIGIARTITALQRSITELAKPAVESFKELRKQADELYLSLSKAQTVTTLIDLAGGDYDDVRDYVRGVQDAVIKGDAEAPEVLALERYGVAIQDTKGKLLEFDEALENLYQGYLKAKEAGEAEAFIIMTNGQAVHDVATLLENYAQAKERTAQIQWSTSDFASLQEYATNLKMAEVQTNEFKNAASTLAVPLANLVAESDFDFFKTLTQLIEENRDTILLWEFTVIEAFKSAKQSLVEYAESAFENIKEINESFGITDKIKNFVTSIDIGSAAVDKLKDVLTSDDTSESIFDAAQKDVDAYNAANEKSRSETEKTKKEIQSGLSYSLRRIQNFQDELKKIKFELQFGNDEYKKALAELEIWKEKSLRNAKYYEEEQTVILELEAAKREQIERKHAEEIKRIEEEKQARLAEIRQSVNSQFQTDLQNRLDAINRDKQSWIQAGMESAEAETLAQKLKFKTIEDLNIEFTDKVNSIYQTSLEKRIAEIEKEKQAWIQKGIDESQAEELAHSQKTKVIEELEESFNDRMLEITGSELEQKIAAIEKEKQAWIDKGIDEVRATELAEQQKAKVFGEAEKEIDNKYTELDSLYTQRSKLYEEFAEHARTVSNQVKSIWDTELNNRLSQIEQERRAFIKQGVDSVAAAKWAAQARVDAERNAAMQILTTQLKALRAFQKGGYEGLKKYELSQLYKQGITPNDLKMTPQQLQKFTFAQKAVKNSLMPNFMTDEDQRRKIAAKSGATTFDLPEITVSMPDNMREALNSLDTRIATLNAEIAAAITALNNAKNYNPSSTESNVENNDANFNENENTTNPQIELPEQNLNYDTPTDLTTPTDNFDTNIDLSNIMATFDELAPSIENLSSYFEDLAPPIENLISYFEELSPVTENIRNCFDELTPQLSAVSSAFGDLVVSIGDANTALKNSSQQQQAQPTNITNNVSIQEAHAWDYSHIQELAEKVADVITPKILSAIGGNPNAY